MRKKSAVYILDALQSLNTKKMAQRLASMLGDKGAQEDEIAVEVARLASLPRFRETKTYQELKSGCTEPATRAGLLSALEELSKLDVVQRGAVVSCSRCALTQWIHLDSLSQKLACSGCQADIQLPVDGGGGRELEWSYALNGLANKVMDVDGLPALALYDHLASEKPLYSAVPGVEFLRNDQCEMELDLLAIRERVIWAAECKSGSELSTSATNGWRPSVTAAMNFGSRRLGSPRP